MICGLEVVCQRMCLEKVALRNHLPVKPEAELLSDRAVIVPINSTTGIKVLIEIIASEIVQSQRF
jgi:hypothetical protein